MEGDRNDLPTVASAEENKMEMKRKKKDSDKACAGKKRTKKNQESG